MTVVKQIRKEGQWGGQGWGEGGAPGPVPGWCRSGKGEGTQACWHRRDTEGRREYLAAMTAVTAVWNCLASPTGGKNTRG